MVSSTTFATGYETVAQGQSTSPKPPLYPSGLRGEGVFIAPVLVSF